MSTPFMIGKQMPHLNCYRSIKKPPAQKVQTVAKPHSPSLYGESISASFTTPLGCTQSCHNFGYKLPTEAQSLYINFKKLSM